MNPTAEPRTGRITQRRTGKRKKDNDFGIFTWNVRTLYQPGKLRVLLDQLEKYKADITAIQEVRWLGKGIMEKRNYTIYYSCREKEHTLGTAFIVRKSLKHAVIGFEAISERMCKIRIKGKFHNYSLINIHAPTEDKSEEEKEAFYENLERNLRKCPRYDVKVIIGDANAKVGQEQIYYPTIGKHSIHSECNDNGRRLVNFAAGANMIVASTKFQHRRIHRVTWKSPNEETVNAIDHILISARYSSSIIDVRTYRGANVDSDHFLVGAKIRDRISCVGAGRRREESERKYNTTALKEEQIREEYVAELNRRFGAPDNEAANINTNIDDEWSKIRTIVKEAAAVKLGYERQVRHQDWFDEECARVTKDKNEAYANMLQRHRTRNSVAIYKEKRRIEKRTHKRKKKTWLEEQITEINELGNNNEVRKFYEKVNKQRKEFKPRVSMCKDKSGNILSQKEEVLKRWREYFNELLNRGDENESDVNQPNGNGLRGNDSDTGADNESEVPTMDDVKEAMTNLKNNKAPGKDNISTEMWKYGGQELMNGLHKLIESIWRQKKIPLEWTEGVICPLHKKGDQLVCENYRGITLLNSAYKILSTILYKKLLPIAEGIIGTYQCGFRPGRSTTNHISTLRRILEKSWEFNIDIHVLFIDFKQAYDSVKREELFKAMEYFRFPKHLIEITKATIKVVGCRVRVERDLSESFTSQRGLRQGDALSCLLFNIVLEKVVRDAGVETTGSIFNKSTQTMAYADDVALIGRSFISVKEAFIALESAAKRMGLLINEAKTKYLCTSKRYPTPRQNITIDTYNIETVKEFIYLGTVIQADSGETTEIRRRINVANRSYFGLRQHLTSRILSRGTKCKLYTTLIKPVLMFGSEAWTLKIADETLLGSFERKVLRTIFGGICENGQWRRRYNQELYQLYKGPDIVKSIKLSRLRWVAHIQRLDDSDPAKIAVNRIPDGRRNTGRPKKRYMDSVEEDLVKLGVRNWRALARNRTAWREMLEEAKASNRL